MDKQVWFIPYFHSQLGKELVKRSLSKGHCVATNRTHTDELEMQTLEMTHSETLMVLTMDPSERGSCIGAVAQIVDNWGHIDIVIHCTTRVYFGAVLEMEDWQVTGQLQSTFFNCTNIMEAVIPTFERQRNGHFIAVTDVNASSGGPGLGVLSGGQQAVESYCEGVALGLLSYNVRVTVVKASGELTVLTNPVVFSEPSLKYQGSLTDKTRQLIQSSTIFPTKFFDNTIAAITAIAGIKDPPGRLFVGQEVIDQVRSKLTAFSEEIDDYE